MRYLLPIFALSSMFAAAMPAVTQPIPASLPASVPHLTVQMLNEESGVQAPGRIDAGLYFMLEPGWHIYWKNAGDSGEPPKIDWTLPKGVTAGHMQFPAPRRLPLGPLMDFGYENEALFPVRLDVGAGFRPGSTIHMAAKVSWLVCRDVCIPGKANLAFDVPVVAAKPGANGGAADLFKRLSAALPRPLPSGDAAIFQPTATGFRVAVMTGQRETQAEFFPEDQDILDNPAPQIVTPVIGGFVLYLKKDPNLSGNPAQLRGVLELSGGRNYEIAATREAGFATAGIEQMPPAVPAFSIAALASTTLLAFLGGLLLNLMPCVFPVLFLKGLALVQSGSEERHKLRAHGLVYTAGILVSFWALVALLLGLRAAGSTLGWGFQFQSPVFLSLMAALLFFLGLSLAGQFEIGLTLTGAGDSLAAKQGYIGSFFTGVLAVVVATPCTAPFMGTAIGYALAQPAAVTFAIFTALAFGLAAPYVALTLQPAWTRLLPRPGAWMDILKQAVSVPIFATVIWLTWVVAQAYGAALLATLLCAFLLLAVAGWFLGRWPARRWAAIVAALILLAVVAACIAAPRWLAEAPAESFAPLSSKSSAARSAVWQPWSEEAVEHALAAGQPVFVDFTAGWCLSCQVNERVALGKTEVMRAFGDKDVVLFKADWTREDPAITQELASLGRSGVPVYALYAPGQTTPTLLPQVLTPGIVLDAIAKLPSAATPK